MVNSVLSHVRQRPDVEWSAVQHLLLVADCGPHFRSKENVAHFCITLANALKTSVEICWLGEQHGKSGVDRCFGWCNRWISDYIHRLPIHGLKDLLKCFNEGSKQMMKEDPECPPIAILEFAPGENRPLKRKYLVSDELKVSRTYSLTSTLSKHAATGVQIRNKVFSDMDVAKSFAWNVNEVISKEPQPWRVGYYDKERSWEEGGPEPGQKNSITRRFEAQKTAKAYRMPKSKPSFLERCSTKALSLRKAAAKKRRKLRLLRGPKGDGTSSSSSSSSSSASSSSSSDTESEGWI